MNIAKLVAAFFAAVGGLFILLTLGFTGAMLDSATSDEDGALYCPQLNYFFASPPHAAWALLTADPYAAAHPDNYADRVAWMKDFQDEKRGVED